MPALEILSGLALGVGGRIVDYSVKNPFDLERLMSMGLVLGAQIRVIQTYPAVVVTSGETMMALEPSLAKSIFVRIGK